MNLELKTFLRVTLPKVAVSPWPGSLAVLGVPAGKVADARNVQGVHGVSGVAIVHDGNDAPAHGDEIAMRHFKLATVRQVNDERNEGSVEPVTDRVQVQQEPRLVSSAFSHKLAHLGRAMRPLLIPTANQH